LALERPESLGPPNRRSIDDLIVDSSSIGMQSIVTFSRMPADRRPARECGP
jgi:hypothetical protein